MVHYSEDDVEGHSLLDKSNLGEYRVLRCDFPHLMGRSTLRRPKWLPRSLKTPYFSGPYSPLSQGKERLYRPHVNRLRVFKDSEDNHMTLRKHNIFLHDGSPIYRSGWGELRVGKWKGKEKEILVRLYNKKVEGWERVEKKLLKEVCHVQDTGHPNFLQYYGSLENPFWKYHLVEYMPRGDLLSFLKEEKRGIGESVARKIFLQIVYAISYLHDKDIVHRNLKLENILLGEDWEVRIIDITRTEKSTAQNRGDSSNIAKTTFNHDYGPALYKGPERVLGMGFNPMLDQVWALGVILYALLFNRFPFSFLHKDEDKIRRMVGRGPDFSSSPISPEAEILLSQIFRWEEERPRSFELFDSHFLLGESELMIEEMKKSNAIGRYTHEEAEKLRNEDKPLIARRKRMFWHFKLFREDYMRQPAYQEEELGKIEKTLENAQRFLGERSYGVYEVTKNVEELHKEERLYREEYWPTLYTFNPLKCKYLGINRAYCKPRNLPVHLNLLRLATKEGGQSYGLPPKRGGDTYY